MDRNSLLAIALAAASVAVFSNSNGPADSQVAPRLDEHEKPFFNVMDTDSRALPSRESGEWPERSRETGREH